MRRRPADPGLRPHGRFASGRCHCGEWFVLDRQVQPWARARTCSEACRAALGNRGRRPASCEHCVMVQGYYQERERQETELENVRRQDEDARLWLVRFGDWLRFYPWPSRPDLRMSA